MLSSQLFSYLDFSCILKIAYRSENSLPAKARRDLVRTWLQKNWKVAQLPHLFPVASSWKNSHNQRSLQCLTER